MAWMQDVIAVVDRQGDDGVVWWIRVEKGVVQRLCGAWFLAPHRLNILPTLVANRWVIPTLSGEDLLARTTLQGYAPLDFAVVEEGVGAARLEISAAYKAKSLTSARTRQLTPLDLPELPEALDVERPPVARNLPGAPRALLIATHIEIWCRAWDHLEQQRLARPYLRVVGGGAARGLPGIRYAPEVIS